MIGRRGFFGASMGAAMAGPQVAKAALEKASMNAGKYWGGNIGGGMKMADVARDTPVSMTSSDHIRMIREQILRVARSKDRVHEQPYIGADTLAAIRLDSLRSVSPQHKMRRAIEISNRIMQEREFEDSQNYLEHMKRDFKERYPLIANLEELING